MFSARLIHAERAGVDASIHRRLLHLFPEDERDLCFFAAEQRFLHRFLRAFPRPSFLTFLIFFCHMLAPFSEPWGHLWQLFGMLFEEIT